MDILKQSLLHIQGVSDTPSPPLWCGPNQYPLGDHAIQVFAYYFNIRILYWSIILVLNKFLENLKTEKFEK